MVVLEPLVVLLQVLGHLQMAGTVVMVKRIV